MEPCLLVPVDLSEASHAVVVGSRRYLAAQALGWTEIRVTIRDMDDAEALAIAIESSR